jgi:hypothetical protein
MIVVIEDWLGLGEVMIEPPGGPGLQEKIFVDEFHGCAVRVADSPVALKPNKCSTRTALPKGVR